MPAVTKSCLSCGRPVALVGGRWVHLSPSPIGMRPRPTFVGCELDPSASGAPPAVARAVA